MHSLVIVNPSLPFTTHTPPMHSLIHVLVSVGCQKNDPIVLLYLCEHETQGDVGSVVPRLKQSLTFIKEQDSVVDL